MTTDHPGSVAARRNEPGTLPAVDPKASGDESLALILAGVAIVIGTAIGLLTLHSTRPLFGRGSIGEVAAYAAMGTAGLAFAATMVTVTPRLNPWLRRVGWPRRLLNLAGLSLLHAVFAFLLVLALFAVFADAFRGVALDHWAGTFWVAASCGVAAYMSAASAMALTTQSLSVLLAAFVPTGALASALSASDPHWWQHHFSALGGVPDDSGFTFTITLLLAGLALVTVGDFLAHDLAIWADAVGEPRWKVTVVRTSLGMIGVLLAAVVLIPVTTQKAWHDAAAQSIVVVFAAALVAFPVLFGRLPGSFRAVTVVVVALLVLCLVLYKGVRYLNTTAFEMGAATTVLVWLLLFARTVSAAVRSQPQPAWADEPVMRRRAPARSPDVRG